MATAGEKVLEKNQTSSEQTTQAALRVQRYLSGQSLPFYQTYEVRFFDEMTVLDALSTIKDTQDGSLSYRWSCRMGICGSCGAMVNGKPVLMCQTNLKDLKGPVTVQPMRNFNVIKDLVVDISDPFEKMRMAMPYFPPEQKKALHEGEYNQTSAQRQKIDQTSQCIKCMLCYSACPVYGHDKDFIGPAASALAYRYQADSREDKKGKARRMDSVISEKGVWKCSFVGECSAVCPKRVDPAQALQRLKLMGALRLTQKILSLK